MTDHRAGRDWTPLALAGLGAMLVLAGWMVRERLADILAIALRDEEQSHVLLVPVVAAWMVWIRRERLRAIRFRRSWWGPATIAGGWLMGWWGFHQGVLVAEHLSAWIVLAGVVLTFTGLAPVHHFAVLAPLVAFAVPVPGALRQAVSMPLQSMAAGVTHESLTLMGIAATRMGNVLVVNGEQIAVAEACNGMRMVFALVLVVYAFAFSLPLRTLPRLLLVASSPLIALLANVVRLVPTSLFYGFGSAEHAETFHDVSGWVMLPVALLLVVKIVDLLRWLELPVLRLRLAAR